MLSWNDDDDVFTRRPSMNKAGSVSRPGNSFEAQRLGSSRKSVDVPAPPGGLTSTMSPTSSLKTSNSLLRGPGLAAAGTIGSEGWWHHMDNSQMNEPPVIETKTKVQVPAAGFMPQYVTGQRQSLWADEPAAAATPAPAAATQLVPEPSPAAPAEVPQAQPADGSPAAAAAAAAPGAAAAAPADGAPSLQNVAASGWWNHMDNSILNQPAETAAPGDVRKGERVMGGGFTPQFNVGGGNRYTSIFAEPEVQQQQQQSGDVEQQAAAGWGPFCGQQGNAPAPAAAAAAAGEDWSSFASAPKA